MRNGSNAITNSEVHDACRWPEIAKIHNQTNANTNDYGMSQKAVSRLSGYRRGAVVSHVSNFIQSHSSGSNLAFETLFESIWRKVTKLWQRKINVSVCFKNSTLLLSSNLEMT